LRIADPDEIEKVLLGDISFLREGGRTDEHDDDQEK
jgi:hypothetical protein